MEPIWTSLFAKALNGKDIKELLTTADTAAAPGTVQEPAPPISDDNEGNLNPDDNSDGDKSDDGTSDGEDFIGLFD